MRLKRRCLKRGQEARLSWPGISKLREKDQDLWEGSPVIWYQCFQQKRRGECNQAVSVLDKCWTGFSCCYWWRREIQEQKLTGSRWGRESLFSFSRLPSLSGGPSLWAEYNWKSGEEASPSVTQQALSRVQSLKQKDSSLITDPVGLTGNSELGSPETTVWWTSYSVMLDSLWPHGL